MERVTPTDVSTYQQFNIDQAPQRHPFRESSCKVQTPNITHLSCFPGIDIFIKCNNACISTTVVVLSARSDNTPPAGSVVVVYNYRFTTTTDNLNAPFSSTSPKLTRQNGERRL